MAGSNSGGRSVLYYAGMGCGTIVLLVALSAAGLAGLAWMQVGAEVVEERDVTRPVEALAVPETPTEAMTGGSTETTATLAASAAGTVEIDVEASGFELHPGEPGEGVRVKARFDAKSYALEQEESIADDGTWVYRIGFRRTGGFLTGIKEMFGGTRPEVTFFLPPDAPVRLRINVDSGGAEVDLGGLWLTDVALEVSKGGFVVECSEPNRVPVERLVLKGSMGGFVFEGVSNLAPREVEASSSMGGMVLDLSGDWAADASIRLSNKMGGMQVILPDAIDFRGLEDRDIAASTGFPPSETPEIAVPVMTFTLSGDLDDIEFTRP